MFLDPLWIQRGLKKLRNEYLCKKVYGLNCYDIRGSQSLLFTTVSIRGCYAKCARIYGHPYWESIYWHSKVNDGCWLVGCVINEAIVIKTNMINKLCVMNMNTATNI